MHATFTVFWLNIALIAVHSGEHCGPWASGLFLVSGSYVATACPLGTYSNVTGAVNEYDCTDCDKGYYCNSVAGGAPSGKCYAGYYCTGRAKVPTQFSTEPGMILV